MGSQEHTYKDILAFNSSKIIKYRPYTVISMTFPQCIKSWVQVIQFITTTLVSRGKDIIIDSYLVSGLKILTCSLDILIHGQAFLLNNHHVTSVSLESIFVFCEMIRFYLLAYKI